MVTLYVKPHCRYSAHALAALDIYNVPFIEKNITEPKNDEELMELGGKHKVPFLVDGDVKMYESEAIANYVAEKYGHLLEGEAEEKKTELRVHKNSEVDTCSDELCACG
jgi:glutathione S-transferase